MAEGEIGYSGWDEEREFGSKAVGRTTAATYLKVSGDYQKKEKSIIDDKVYGNQWIKATTKS